METRGSFPGSKATEA